MSALPSPASVRDACPGDLDAAACLMVAAYAEYLPAEPTGPWLAYREEIRDVRGRLGVATLIVAEAGGRMVGAVHVLSRRRPGRQRELAAGVGRHPTARRLSRGSRTRHRPVADRGVHSPRAGRWLRSRRPAHDGVHGRRARHVRAHGLHARPEVRLLARAPDPRDGIPASAPMTGPGPMLLQSHREPEGAPVSAERRDARHGTGRNVRARPRPW